MRLTVAATVLAMSVSSAPAVPVRGDAMAGGSQRDDVGVHLRAAGPVLAASDDEELTEQQRRIEHHLLRVQQERFEARNRGEPEQRLQRLDKEFRRTQKRWGAVHRARESQGQ
jgi:hypothetical protein